MHEAAITSSYHCAKIYMAEVGFHAKAPSASEIMSRQSSRAWYYSPARGEILIECLQASKDYLDYLLTLSSKTFSEFAVTEYFRLIYAILIFGEFTAGCDCPSIGSVGERANILHYLDAFIGKLDSLVTFSGTEEIPDFMWKLRMMFQGSRIEYAKIVMAKLTGSLDSNITGLSFMHILSTAEASIRCDTPTLISDTDHTSLLSTTGLWMDMSQWSSTVDPSLINNKF
jgi:hypothetical protein